MENSTATVLRSCHSFCLSSFNYNSNTGEINTLVYWTWRSKAALRLNMLHYHTVFERVMKGFRKPRPLQTSQKSFVA